MTAKVVLWTLSAKETSLRGLTLQHAALKSTLATFGGWIKKLWHFQRALQAHLSSSSTFSPFTGQLKWLFFSGSFYYVSLSKSSWQQSQTFCRGKGADLIVINSNEEQVHVFAPHGEFANDKPVVAITCFLRFLQTNWRKPRGSAPRIQREREDGNGWMGLTLREGSPDFTQPFFLPDVHFFVNEHSELLSATGVQRSQMVADEKIALNSRITIVWTAGTMNPAHLHATGSVRRGSLHNTANWTKNIYFFHAFMKKSTLVWIEIEW